MPGVWFWRKIEGGYLDTHLNTYIIKNMAVQKSTEKNIRKLAHIGRQSIGVTLPIEMVRELGWREKQKVVVKKIGSRIIIEDWKTTGR